MGKRTKDQSTDKTDTGHAFPKQSGAKSNGEVQNDQRKSESEEDSNLENNNDKADSVLADINKPGPATKNS